MHCPVGITINEMNGDIYVCDSNDCIIQMFCKDLPLKSQFGQGILKAHRDVKLTNEFIYVLSCYEPFLCSFAYDLTQIDNTAISSISKQLSCPNAFCIDGSGHFIISEYNKNAILIFNQQGELVHTINDCVSSRVAVGKKFPFPFPWENPFPRQPWYLVLMESHWIQKGES